ncbi:MAG TPA: 16S rRNA (adenine(1518)-N(6)/adenine(1519)-N(6))-dimethyltransferase RsmA [Vicinamibacterales bacterium]|nr:16S rRNA (adenine(1518)-N(6)/adenine(1519)-N(6))-dimethyltransferase RsmA [Vicinamibacterales bacterium]
MTRARKRYGQHFLEPVWVDKVIDALGTSATDVFLEIGPGRGALTRPLATRVERLVAVEIDRDLAATLRGVVPPNVTIIQGDFLDVDLANLLDSESAVRVVGNLPYNVSSPILFKLLDASGHGATLRDATLMLQKEVADRLVARPGTGDYGALAIQVALVADVERLLALPPGAFRPPPKVRSAVVRLTFRPPSVEVGDPAIFERLVRGLFLHRRKTVLNALRPVADSLDRSSPTLLERAGIEPSRRPETLTLHDLARLARAVL